ncbi:MAG: hypothetical protein WCF84_01230 [Anaerolineae bacterium]
MMNRLPRALLAILGVLSTWLLWNDLQVMWMEGPALDSVLLCILIALIACVCFSAAAGAGQIFTGNK